MKYPHILSEIFHCLLKSRCLLRLLRLLLLLDLLSCGEIAETMTTQQKRDIGIRR